MVILSNEVVWGFLFVGFFGVWVLLGRGSHCHVGGQTNRSSACEIKSIIWLLWRGMEPSQKSWAEEEATYLSVLLPPSVRPRRTFKIIQTIMCCVVLCCFWPKEIFPKEISKGDPVGSGPRWSLHSDKGWWAGNPASQPYSFLGSPQEDPRGLSIAKF